MTITHTIARTVTIAGTLEYPTAVEPLFDHEGQTLEATDGTPTNLWASSKRRWKITWESPLPAVVERMRTRYTARSTFAFVDPYGASYTAMIPVGAYRPGYSYPRDRKDTIGTTYTLEIEVWEV